MIPKEHDYVYENFHDLCMGRATPPLKIRNHLTIGQHYLIPCFKLCRQTSQEDLESFASKILSQISEIENFFAKDLRELIIEIELNSSLSSHMLESIILPVFKRIQSWPKVIKLRASLTVHLHCDIDLYESSNFDNNMKSLINTFNDICSSGVDILWLSLESLPVGYLLALEKQDLRKAIEIFYEYYEKCALFTYSLFSLYQHPLCTLALNSPSWMIPATLPESVAKIYRPLVILVASKLMSLPSLCQKSNCLSFGQGAGAIAKAMTGAPLMVPNLFEVNFGIGNRALALADIVSTQLSCQQTSCQIQETLNYVKGVQDYINYYNLLHEKEGYLANQETRNILMKSRTTITPLHLLIDYPKICEIARRLFLSSSIFSNFLQIEQDLIKQFFYAEEQGILNLSPTESEILLRCKEDFKNPDSKS